ncbi:hypothetical protein BDZ89DRAFT_1066152 [Hymenopellis radicata]|nr:hypothetical protein BDZ89DRAFT_1066152 [Hymenopellis radicata]
MAEPLSAGRRIYSAGLPLPDLRPSLSQPLTWFARDNLPISDTDAQFVKEEILTAALGNLADVDSRLEELRAEMLGMTAERNRWQETVDHCRGALSPLRRLPSEVLGEMFQIFCSQTDNIVDILDGPWLLSHVCSLWRRIVLSTPSLWTHIAVCNSFQPRASHAYPYASPALLDAALSHSNDLPLNVYFKNDADPTKLSEEFLYDRLYLLLGSLMRVAERWQHCSFCLLPQPEEIDSLEAVKGRLISLETLKIEFSAALRMSELQTIDTFEVAPKLRCVELYAVDYYRFILPFAQLACIREHWCNALEDDVIDDTLQAPVTSFQLYLLDCTQLDELHLVHSFFFHRVPDDPVPLISHRLRSLIISDPRLLDIVELPCLEALDIKTLPYVDDEGLTEWPECPNQMYAPIVPFLQHSRCPLKCLKITEPEVHTLTDILRLTPLLERLKLRYNRWGHMDASDIPALLAVLDPAQNPDVLPNLQSLTIHLGARGRNCTYGYPGYVTPWLNEAFNTAVANRQSGQLRKLLVMIRDFDFPSAQFEEALDRLGKCKRDGMDISVSTLIDGSSAQTLV